MKKLILSIMAAALMAVSVQANEFASEDKRNHALMGFLAAAGTNAVIRKNFEITETQNFLISTAVSVAIISAIGSLHYRGSTFGDNIMAGVGGATAGAGTSYVLWKFSSGE